MEEISDIETTFALFTEESRRLEKAQIALQEKFKDMHYTLEMITSHMSDGLIFVTEEGYLSLFNGAAEKLSGLTKEDVKNKLFWDVFDDTLFGFSLKEVLGKSALQKRILLTFTKCDESKEIEVSTSVVPGKGALLLLSDRTALRQLEQGQQQQTRLHDLGEMAASLAHEIRNPLGGITGFASLLKEDLENPSHLKMLSSIIQGTDILNQLVNNVLDYTQELPLHFVPTDIVTLIKESIAFSKADGMACSLITKKQSLIASVDPKQMMLVLLNLIRNGIEAGSKKVTLTLTEKNSLEIQDWGSGISEKNLSKITSPFFTTKTRGTGLGLARVSKILDAHGIEFKIESKEGVGTKITLQLC